MYMNYNRLCELWVVIKLLNYESKRINDWYWVCDSLDAIEILMEAEREFGVVIPDDRIEHIKTVRDAIDLIMELDSI